MTKMMNQKMTEVFKEIDIFLSSPVRNTWVFGKEIEIYLRKSHRVLEGEYRECIDLASITVTGVRGQGIFTSFLEIFLEHYNDKNIFVESILTKRFANFFFEKGFKYISNCEPCQIDMYLLKK